MTWLKNHQISPFGKVTTDVVVRAGQEFGTPHYLYDESVIVEKCSQVLAMPNAFGLTARYAVKANASRALIQLIHAQGMHFDMSTLNEARRVFLAGVPWDKMMLTSQEIPEGQNRTDIESMIQSGLTYNVCSLRQLELIADFASKNRIPLAMRINPGVGAGESVTRNTGDKYSSFGIHLANMDKAMDVVKAKGLLIRQVHVHIGSGGDPDMWRENIDRELEITEKYFPDARTVNLGGGFKEARMPDETAANIEELGYYAKERFEDFARRTGRQLHMGIEPGTFIMANAGYLVAKVMDEKWSGPTGFEFIIIDAGMEANTRPLLYGSRHPFYIVSKTGQLLSSEYDLNTMKYELDFRVVVGRCCESGDSQSLDYQGHIIPRTMADPEIGDYFVIGGTGAYCSAMSLVNYNSLVKAPEVLLRKDGTLQLIRKRQTLEQIVQDELALD
ncbi:MAG: diaminopimelate decarboxylase [Deltaproteobacteria bacterium]|nr:diaminopimelate decarboxylase [Deltaproteobacteria bacterium]